MLAGAWRCRTNGAYAIACYNAHHTPAGFGLSKHQAKRPLLSSVYWPPDETNRIIHTGARLQILSEDWNELAAEWIVQLVGDEAAAVIGIPDTSANPLADLSRQLSVPGLFGYEPYLQNPEESAKYLIGEAGLFSKAGLWPKLQNVEYMTRGAGDFFVRTDVSSKTGAVKLRLIPPTCVWQAMDPECPSDAIELWELRLRWLKQSEEWVYAWDAYDISDPDHPTFRVLRDRGEGNEREDITNLVVAEGVQVSGDGYPYRTSEGVAFIPIVQFASADTGMPWHWREKKGVHRGTLNTAFNWTFAQRGLRAASGRAVIAWGLQPLGADVVRPNGQPIRTAPILPGSMAFLKSDGSDTPPSVIEVGPGAHLGDLLNYCTVYEMKQAARYGLTSPDTNSQHANPTSGKALFVSNADKRSMQRQLEPVFRPSVIELVEKTAALVNGNAGTMLVPESGYSWRPRIIPDSPAEMKERRDDTDWQTERGHLSPIDALRRFNPGITDEAAADVIVGAKVTAAMIEQRIAAALVGVATEDEDPPAPDPTAPPVSE